MKIGNTTCDTPNNLKAKRHHKDYHATRDIIVLPSLTNWEMEPKPVCIMTKFSFVENLYSWCIYFVY